MILAILMQAGGDAVRVKEFIYETAPFPACHASTIVEVDGRLVAAWFGGTAEKNPDVTIWLSRHDGAAWSAPVQVATGVQADGTRFPCWNPVLFKPRVGPLQLFYKVGPSPSLWWGMLVTSDDGGKTWSEPARLPDGRLGPIKNKPVELAGGTIVCGSSTEKPGEGWRAHLEVTADGGKTWTTVGPLNDERQVQVIQPTVLDWGGGRLQLLMRNRNVGASAGKIVEAWSSDGGKSWGAPKATALANPNSGIDAVKLKDGRALLVYNNTPRGRTPLAAAVSSDGAAWKDVLVLESEPGEYSYPAVIQGADGTVHVTYTWRRQRVRHVAIDPEKVAP